MTEDQITEAKHLFWQGWKVADIAQKMGVAYSTIDSRKRRDGWQSVPQSMRMRQTVEARYNALVLRNDKSAKDQAEIEKLGKELERTARIATYEKSGKASDLNPKIKNRNNAKKAKKNHIPDELAVKLIDDFHDSLFDYQHTWLDNKHHRTRVILKSRQIGATWYFAREAFVDALETGDNQIFLSASRAQAEIFRGYITAWVFEVTGIELKGNPLALPNGATLYFLSTNSRTSQGYHGHVYADEFFWMPKFSELNKVASGMAMHKKWRKTYFSTPSIKSHEAYPFWTGNEKNKGRKRDDHQTIDVSHKTLRCGRLCEDGIWRHMVTIEDAVAGGCDLFDLDALRTEYSDEEFDNLLMCQFMDDALSVFRFAQLGRCGVDSMVAWDDYRPDAKRPFGNWPVWLGYDPSRTGDDASLAIIAPPPVAGGKYRVLETLSWSGEDFDTQAKRIREVCGRFNVQKIVIDASGIGQGVYELVAQFFPAAVRLTYSVEVKSRLVLRALQLVNGANINWDSGAKDIPAAFMTIHQTSTPSSGQITYKANRTADTGHADKAWAIMHALDGTVMEAIGQTTGGGLHRGFMEII